MSARALLEGGYDEVVGIGGIIVPALAAVDLADRIGRICADAGFPEGEVFK